MPRTFRPLLTVVAAAALVLPGCTSTVSGSAAPAGSAATAPSAAATSDPVKWIDDVCGALLTFTSAAAVQPDINTSGDPGAALKGLSDYLGRAVAALDSAISGMAAAGPSPVEGGDQIVQQLTATLTKFRTSFQSAKDTLDKTDPKDPAALVALPTALAPLQEVASTPDPTLGIKSNPKLDKAAEQAPNCKKVSGG